MRFHRTGAKRLHHPLLGDLDLTYEAMELTADAGQTLLVYTAEPATPTADALQPSQLDRPTKASATTTASDEATST